MIRICHITSVHNSNDVRIFEKECTSLAKNPEFKVFLVAKGESYQKNNVNIIGGGRFSGNRLLRALCYSSRLVKKAIELNADIYHLHDPELLLYAKKLKQKGKKVIFDSHEFYPAQIRLKNYLPKCIRGLVAKIFESYQNAIIKKLDAVIFPTTINGINPFEGKNKRAEIISNAAILEEFNDLSFEIEKKEFIACYVGRLAESRGISTIVDACLATETKLILAGAFSSQQFGDKLKERHRYDEFIENRGLCNRDEVGHIYKEASCGLCVLDSVGQYATIETLATKVCEYMSVGLPVIMNSQPYNDMMATKFGFGITVKSEDVVELAEALELLKSSETLAKSMGQKGYDVVCSHLNWGVEEKKLTALYDEILFSGE